LLHLPLKQFSNLIDGRRLKDFKTQERYWAVIEDRVCSMELRRMMFADFLRAQINQHLTKYDPNAEGRVTLSLDEAGLRQMKESEDIILIHLSKRVS
jgi:hypothetical protein